MSSKVQTDRPQHPPAIATAEFVCVDLDGTLVETDMLWENIILCIRQSPISLLLFPFWLLKGRAYAKSRLVTKVKFAFDTLPYRPQVLAYLQDQKKDNARIVLTTASTSVIAEGVAAHLRIFDSVYSSDESNNLKGANKARKLREVFGQQKFVYAGDSRADLPVWASASSAVVVGSESLCAAARRVTTVDQYIPTSPLTVSAVVRAMRVHHWSKNFLLFLPLLLSHQMHLHALLRDLAGFLFFGLSASSAYLSNDILDLNSDRHHPWKRKRPLASGVLSIRFAVGLTLALLCTALLGSLLLVGRDFTFLIAGYWVASNVYSTWLKRVPLVDIFVLAGFYVFRIVAGSMLAEVVLSFWFLLFSGFFFLSLGTAKRCSELIHAADLTVNGSSGRGYVSADRELLSMIGIGSAFAAIIVLLLYTNSPDVTALYVNSHRLVFLGPLLLLWTTRLWLKSHRGELHEDPISWALRDRGSYLIAAAAVIIILLSSPHPRL